MFLSRRLKANLRIAKTIYNNKRKIYFLLCFRLSFFFYLSDTAAVLHETSRKIHELKMKRSNCRVGVLLFFLTCNLKCVFI